MDIMKVLEFGKPVLVQGPIGCGKTTWVKSIPAEVSMIMIEPFNESNISNLDSVTPENILVIDNFQRMPESDDLALLRAKVNTDKRVYTTFEFTPEMLSSFSEYVLVTLDSNKGKIKSIVDETGKSLIA